MNTAEKLLRAWSSWNSASDTLRVLQTAAYNGERIGALLDCVNVAVALLQTPFNSADPSFKTRLQLVSVAAAFLANLSIGIDDTTARELEATVGIVEATTGALGRLAVLSASTVAVAVAATLIARIACHVCNTLVHLSGSLQSALLERQIGEPLGVLAHNIDWADKGKLHVATTLAYARLAHNLVPRSLTFASAEAPPGAPLAWVENLIDNCGAKSPWGKLFAAAWDIANLLNGTKSLFDVASPVYDAVLLLAVVIEVRLPEALQEGGEDKEWLVFLLAVRVRLWLGGVVPDNVSEETVALWTDLCSYGLHPDFAKKSCETGGMSAATFASDEARRALAAAADSCTPSSEADAVEDWALEVERRTEAALARAAQVIADPWLKLVQKAARNAMEEGDLRFDASVKAFFVVGRPLECCSGTSPWVEMLGRNGGATQVSDTVALRLVKPLANGEDGDGVGDSGDEKEPDIARSIAQVLNQDAYYLYHGSLAQYSNELTTDNDTAVADRAAGADPGPSDFAGLGHRRFYLTASLDTAVAHAEKMASDIKFDDCNYVDVCVVAFRVDRKVFTAVQDPVIQATGSYQFQPAAAGNLTLWRPQMCEWEELVTECQSSLPNRRPFYSCNPTKNKCTCQKQMPLCARDDGPARAARAAAFATPPCNLVDQRPSAAAVDPQAPAAASAGGVRCTNCRQLHRCYCSKPVACHANPKTREPLAYAVQDFGQHLDVIEGPESRKCRTCGGQLLRDNKYGHQIILRTGKAMAHFSSLPRTVFAWRWNRFAET
eukprot:TRINITY_DN1363_c0_g3_i1.p1 TRINITY_DN1363_c0_g3~~TRINITY_DN1363_c0_g3_i1.p1  ORF type:complete len:778 (-),score=142.02 TRINITY_DN1363_c0_g3_i1:125-2458(-)